MTKFISLSSLFLMATMVLGHHNQMSTAYTLKPTPKTVAWGYYDAKAAPVLRVKSGDTVEIADADHFEPEAARGCGVAAGAGRAIAARHHRRR